jgi:NAD(P)H-flavin reductase
MSPLPTRLAPVPLRVLEASPETADSTTLVLETGDFPVGAPGQFNMLYPFGLGEAAISISAVEGGNLVHTVRGVGPVSEGINRLRPGDWLGVRGPFGVGWPMQAARGRTVILVAGGIGLAPLRPAIHAVLREPAAFDRLLVFYGARTPRERLFVNEIAAWEASSDIEFFATVDSGDANWAGRVGFVTALLANAQFDSARTVAMTCGPEIMMRAVANQLRERGMAGTDIYVSMERNMKCAAGLCGHCQFGPLFICKDGPVFTYDRIAELMTVREI